RARVSKDEDEPVHPPSCFETHRSAAESVHAPVLASRCDAPQHEGQRARRILTERTQPVPLGSSPRKRGPMITASAYGSRLSLRWAGTTMAWFERRTNLRLWETIAGLRFPVSGLFFTGNAATPTCRALGARSADLTPPGTSPPYFSLLFAGAAERRSAAVVSGRALRARGAVTACRLNRSRGQP